MRNSGISFMLAAALLAAVPAGAEIEAPSVPDEGAASIAPVAEDTGAVGEGATAVAPVEAGGSAPALEGATQAGPGLSPVAEPPQAPAFALPPSESRPRAPEFSLRTLSGERLKLSDTRGKVVVLSFWATWCAPCKQELPVLQSLLERYGKDGLAVLAINTDDPKTVAEVRRFIADRKLTMPIPLDGDNKVLGRFNPRHALPFLQILDHEGRRTFQHTGFTSGAEKILEEQVLALLAERPATVATP